MQTEKSMSVQEMGKTSSRRLFLQSSAFAASTSLIPATAKATPRNEIQQQPLKIGLMTYMLAAKWDIDTIIKNCTEAEYLSAELRTTHAHGVEVSLNRSQRQEVKKRFEDSPIETLTLSSAFAFHSPDPQVLKKNIEGTRNYIKLAQDVGAENIRVFPNALPKEVPVEQTKQQIGRAVGELAQFAQDHGVDLKISVHGYGTNSAPVIKDIIDYSQSPHVYVNWNCNKNDDEGKGFEHNVSLVIDRIKSVHIHELWDTTYPYRLLFKRLREAEFTGYCNIEVMESPEPVRLMKYSRALFLALQDAY